MKFIAILPLLLFGFFVNAQVVCSISVNPMTADICYGDSVNITSLSNLLNAGQTFDFNTGNVPGGWQTAGGNAFSQPCGVNSTGTPYYWASTVAAGQPPGITTAAFDVSCGGIIEFDMVFAVQSGSAPCEGPDLVSEGVQLQYSNNGGLTWIPIIYYTPNGTTAPSQGMATGGGVGAGQITPYTSWATYSITIPPGAMTTNTMFQWTQFTNSGTCCDNWGLDNIVINATGAPCGSTTVVNWSNGVLDSEDFWFAPGQDTTLVAYVYDTLGNYMCESDTIYLNVEYPATPNAGLDQTTCLGDPIYLDGTQSTAGNAIIWMSDVSAVFPSPTVNFSPNASSIDPTVNVNQEGTYLFILGETSAICGQSTDTVVVVVSELDIVASTVSPSCEGFTDGEIHITSLDAVVYSFDNGLTWVADSFFYAVSAGMHSVCARSATGCEKCINVLVSDPPPVTISVSNDTLICENGTAYLSASATGGTSYLFHWGHTGNTDPAQSVNPSAATTYTVYAENEVGCISPIETIDVTIRPGLAGSISLFDTICPGYPTTIMAGAAGGIGTPYTYVWSSGDNATTGATHTISVNPPATQMYTVTISDGCESTPIVLQTQIYVAPLPVPSYNILDPEQCEPAQFNIVNTTDPAMCQYVYWLVDGEQEFLNQNQILTDSLWAGQYDIQMIVTSYLGCVDSITFVNALDVKPRPVADFRYSPNPVTMFNTSVHFQNYSVNGYTYQWFFDGAYPSTSNLTNVTVQYPDGITGTYEVMLITTSQLGCVDTTWQQVVVQPEVLIYAPNTFTPDGDEFNQDWKIFMEGVDFYDFELLIFDRWGETVWESHDISVGWDGTYMGKKLPAGSNTWIVRAKDILNDGKYTYTGHVNILY